MRLSPEDLVLCAGTLMGAGFRDLVEAAAAGGFQGITLWPDTYRSAVAEGLSPRDMRTVLNDHGLVVSDLDPLLGWLPLTSGPEPMPGAASEEEFYAIAQAVGASCGLEELVEHFAGLCDRAAQQGLRITLEFLPWSDVPDVASAWEVVGRAGRPNAGLCFDTWHWFRGARDLAGLSSVPGERVTAVQINDAPARSDGDLIAETLDGRLLPGAGDIPLREVLATLRTIGCTAPLAVEVFSRELRRLPPAEVGRRCGEAARALLGGAAAFSGDDADPAPRGSRGP